MSFEKPVQSPSVLTIAGSDCSGGAGIQADLKTFCAYGCYGTSVITALTAQNTNGVQDIHPVPPPFIEKQIQMVLSDIDIQAIKIGMLFDTDNTKAVVRSIKEYYSSSSSPRPPIICDPVCVSTSGHPLLHPEALDTLISDVIPLATIITPNKSEAEMLLSKRGLTTSINTLEEMISATSRMISAFAPHAVLLKGGHVHVTIQDVQQLLEVKQGVQVIKHGLMEENMEILFACEKVEIEPQLVVVDVLQERGGGNGGGTTLFVRPRINSTKTHGTGCTLSAATACALAQGNTLIDAVDSATWYTHMGIETAEEIGSGHGPLNHLHSTTKILIPRRTKHDKYPFIRYLIKSTAAHWKAYVEHEFVKQLGRAVLPRSAFIHYIIQDYHYLKYYARAHGLLAAKSSTFVEIESATQTLLNILREIDTHRSFCRSFGITQGQLESTPETLATIAYGAFLMDIGLQGDSTKLLLALLVCLLGYGEIGLWLKREATNERSSVITENNPYEKWINDYSGERYQHAVKLGLAAIETQVTIDAPSPIRLKEWREVWDKCTLLEKGFWDSAMEHA